MTKADLRLDLAKQLRAWMLRRETYRAASAALCAQIETQRWWQEARLVCAFLPLPSEPHIAPLWAQRNEPSFCFPRVRGSTVELIQTEDRALLGRADWKLAGPEFDAAPVIAPDTVDLFLVPGLAFTADGRRLGRGAGYYDRLLLQRSPASAALGVCFALQLIEDLPVEDHDQRVDAVITELGLAR